MLAPRPQADASRSSWNRRRLALAFRYAPRRDGTIGSSGRALRPVSRSNPESIHSARIRASVGCTGISRGFSVFVPFTLRFFVL